MYAKFESDYSSRNRALRITKSNPLFLCYQHLLPCLFYPHSRLQHSLSHTSRFIIDSFTETHLRLFLCISGRHLISIPILIPTFHSSSRASTQLDVYSTRYSIELRCFRANRRDRVNRESRCEKFHAAAFPRASTQLDVYIEHSRD